MVRQTSPARPPSRLRLLLVVAALMAAELAATPAAAYLPPTYNIVIKAYVLYQDAPSSAVSLTSANMYCMDKGMNIFSGENPDRDNTFASTSYAQTGKAGAMTYAGTSAEPNAAFSATCSTSKDRTVYPNGERCVFTLRYGLFTISNFLPNEGQVGSAQYYGLYSSFMTSMNLPAGYPITWEKLAGENPNGGYFAVSHAVSSTFGAHRNVDATVPSINVPDASQMMIFCESQAYLGYPPYPTVLTQPSFIKGYKELTWAQTHWWVIFAIVAGVIFAVLLAIFIYCSVSRVRRVEGPPIIPMVMRERAGAPYINVIDDEASAAKPRSASRLQSSVPVTPPPPILKRPQSLLVVVPMPVPVVNPEDVVQATPSVFSREETLQTTEGDSVASEEEKENKDQIDF